MPCLRKEGPYVAASLGHRACRPPGRVPGKPLLPSDLLSVPKQVEGSAVPDQL